MARRTGLALRYGTSLMCTLVAVSAGCKPKQPATVPAATGRTSRQSTVPVVPGRTISMTVKVFKMGKGPGPLLREMKKTISTTGPTRVTPVRDKSIGTTWHAYAQYQVEYHWPVVDVDAAKTDVAPGVELKHAVTMDRCWPYRISHAGDSTHVILKGGIVVHVIQLPENSKISDVVEPAIAWMDRDVAARLARYAKDAKELQAQTPSR